MITREALAPTIDTIKFSDQEETNTITPAVGDTVNLEDYAVFSVEASAANLIEPTAWSGFGVKIGIDVIPSTLNGLEADTFINLSSANNVYKSKYNFTVDGVEILPGKHNIVIVVYDVANNRCEKHLPLNISDNSTAWTTAPSLASYEVTDLQADIRTYGVSREWLSNDISTRAMNSSSKTSYRAQLSFSIKEVDNTDPDNPTVTYIPIRGFKIYRAEGAGEFAQIAIQNYGFPYEVTTHTFFDADSCLKEGIEYTYKVVPFNFANDTKSSNTAVTKVNKPFTASLVSPANRLNTELENLPNFSFRLSDTSLWNATESDKFWFSLLIKDKGGTPVYYGHFVYLFDSEQFGVQVLDGSTMSLDSLAEFFSFTGEYITYNNGTITINSEILAGTEGYTNFSNGANCILESGKAYEWDIIDNYDTSNGNGPCYFAKTYTNGIAKAYADAYSSGGNTTNGMFEFSIK